MSNDYGFFITIILEVIMDVGKKFLVTREAADRMGIAAGTLNNMAWRRVGPKFFKVGRKRIYDVSDVDSFVQQNPVLTADQH